MKEHVSLGSSDAQRAIQVIGSELAKRDKAAIGVAAVLEANGRESGSTGS